MVSLLILWKWYPRALYRRRRQPTCLRCDFPFFTSGDLSEILADSSMVVPPSFLSSTLPSIRSLLCTTDLLLLLIASAWSLLESAMVVVRLLMQLRKGLPLTPRPQVSQVRCTPSVCRRSRPSRVRLCSRQYCELKPFKQ